ncbi:hypothetical protein [Amycolatopsis sp. La24]|uniref:hypothetical protein n=1 Tax=Amycolatopsis sp. La24 TaxID=3028304 RepID=UPI000566A6C7|nr:hypothetical protein [Amycolatopsis sp. La24]
MPELSHGSGTAPKTVGRWCQGSGYGVVGAVTTRELVTVAVDTCGLAKKAATAVAGRVPR